MASAIDNQLGLAAESVYGTFVTPARFLEFTGDGLALDKPRIAAAGQRPGDRVLRTDHWMPGKKTAGGDLEFELGNKGFGILFEHALGAAAAPVADGTGWHHTFTIGDLLGLSLSVQVGRADVGGTVDPMSYVGCKVTELSLSQEVEAFAMLSVSFDAADEATDETLGSASAPAETELFGWDDLIVTVDGSPMDVKSASVSITNNLNTDRFFTGASEKKEPIENAKRDLSGSLTGEFESLTAYNRFVNGTIVPIVFTWTGQTTYDTAKPYKLVWTFAACRFDGETPQSDGQEIIEQALPFVALDNGSAEPVQVDLYTSDAAP